MTRALFATALAGVLVVVGLALAAWTPYALIPYAAAVLLAALVVVRRARALRHQAERAAGRTCTCCTSTVFDPVTVVDERVR